MDGGRKERKRRGGLREGRFPPLYFLHYSGREEGEGGEGEKRNEKERRVGKEKIAWRGKRGDIHQKFSSQIL